ncbi:ABC transporter ATP-binding protein [Miltoncostaea marina]|uniref:ABC transporter ATP-binding protein n=1 Tax=Miltoncostaea marina TaxID=2843215 RepID=UPI001C3D32A4|nr:ATP-binding cassette domain-containing protein [Miltoncostaea marina]
MRHAPPPDAPAIELDGVTKRYGRRTAVDRLTLEVPPGVVAGLIGPNGAGKTTAMAILLGLVRPTSGGGAVLGGPIGRPEAYMHRVGALIEGPAFHPHLTGRESLRMLAVLGRHDPAAVPGLLELVELGDRGDEPVRGYSLGMRQRLGIAAALLGDPALLVLDEPTNGLDPAGIREMRELIARLGRGRRTVLVSSHALGEVEQVCDWLIVIDRGRARFAGPAAGLLGADELVTAPAAPGDVPRLAALLERLGHDVRAGLGAVSVPVGDADPSALAARVNSAAMNEGIVLAELHRARASLERSYLSLVGTEAS